MKKALLVLLVVAAFAVPTFPQTQSNSNKSKRGEAYLHFAKAKMLAETPQLTEGILNQAIAEYKKALELDPNNSLIYSEMADTYLRAQHVRDAVTSAQSAVKADANNIDAHKILASVYTSMIGDAN